MTGGSAGRAGPVETTHRGVRWRREPDGQISQAYDSAIILDKIAPAALQKAKPGTKEFRHALRDELFKVRELPGSRGIYNFKQGQPYGLDSRATVMVAVKDGKWFLLPE